MPENNDFSDFYGLVSNSQDHRVAWAVGKCLNKNLSRQAHQSVRLSTKSEVDLIHYRFTSEHGHLDLFKNRLVAKVTGTQLYLLPELRTYDFVLRVTDLKQSLPADFVLSQIRALEDVQYVAVVQKVNLKNLSNLNT